MMKENRIDLAIRGVASEMEHLLLIQYKDYLSAGGTRIWNIEALVDRRADEFQFMMEMAEIRRAERKRRLERRKQRRRDGSLYNPKSNRTPIP